MHPWRVSPLLLALTLMLTLPVDSVLAQEEIGQIGCLDDGSNCVQHIYGLGYDPEVDSVKVVVQRANPAGTDCFRHAGINPVKGQIVIRERTDTPAGEPIPVEIPLQGEVLDANGVDPDARSFWSVNSRSYQTAAFLGAIRLDNFGVAYVEGTVGQRIADTTLGPNGTKIDWDADGKLGTCTVSETPCSHPDFCALNSDRRCERSTDETGAALACGPGVGSCPGDVDGAEGCVLNTSTSEFCNLGDDIADDQILHFYEGGSCCDSTNNALCDPFFGFRIEYPIIASRGLGLLRRYVTDFLFPDGGAGTDFRSAEETYPGQRWGVCETNGTRFGQLGDAGCSAAEIPSVCAGAPDFSVCNTKANCEALGWTGDCVPRLCTDAGATCKIRMIGLNFGEDGLSNQQQSSVINSDGTPNTEVCQNEGVHFVGTAAAKCSIPERIWLGSEDGPAPDPTPFCALGNYGVEARPDLDCDGTIDGVDLCPEIIEDNPFLDRNGDGIGNECQCGDPNASGALEAADLFDIFNCLAAPEPVGSCRVNAHLECSVDSDCPLFDPDDNPVTPPIERCVAPVRGLLQPCLGFLPKGGKGIAKADANGTGAYESDDLFAIFGATRSQDGSSLTCLLRSSPLLGTCSSPTGFPCSLDEHCAIGGVCIPAAP